VLVHGMEAGWEEQNRRMKKRSHRHPIYTRQRPLC
jgi:hypothetical protein